MGIKKLTTDDNRLGVKGTDKTPAKWPEFDIMGNAYTRPVTTYGLPGKRGLFVVLPSGFKFADIDQIQLEGTRAAAAKPEGQ